MAKRQRAKEQGTKQKAKGTMFREKVTRYKLQVTRYHKVQVAKDILERNLFSN
jgi:hypothetical protein